MVVLVAAVWVGVSKLELIALLLAIAFVFITEMINSAIEQAIDVATTSFDPLAKLAKDVAAGAVLIATVNAVAIGYLVFSGQVADRSSRLLDRLRDAPAQVTLVALVLTIIVVIGTKAYTGPRHAAARRLAVGPRRGRLRRLDGGDVRDQRLAPLPDLVADLHHGAPRGADAGRIGSALGARGHLRRAARAR